jgi:hypothetical protein
MVRGMVWYAAVRWPLATVVAGLAHASALTPRQHELQRLAGMDRHHLLEKLQASKRRPVAWVLDVLSVRVEDAGLVCAALASIKTLVHKNEGEW